MTVHDPRRLRVTQRVCWVVLAIGAAFLAFRVPQVINGGEHWFWVVPPVIGMAIVLVELVAVRRALRGALPLWRR